MKKIKLRKWVIKLLSVILITNIIFLAMDIENTIIFILCKAINIAIIYAISKIFVKYGILEAL